MEFKNISLTEIAAFLGTGFHGPNVSIDGLTKIVSSRLLARSAITFCTNPDYMPLILGNPGIAAVIVGEPGAAGGGIPYLISRAPMEDFYKLHQHLWETRTFYRNPPSPATIGENCTIHPTAVIEDDVIIGDHVDIGPMCLIREGTRIGDFSSIDSHTVIGTDGFEIKNLVDRSRIVSHAGGVLIGTNVEIGVGCVVDKSLFEGHTRIDDDAKIDNHVQVAHDCRVGKGTIICSKVQLSGNVAIGTNCYLAPGAILRDQVEIADTVTLGMGAVVTRSIAQPGVYYGSPARLKKPLF